MCVEMHENKIGDVLIDTAFYIHKKLGPGLLENVSKEGISRIINGNLDSVPPWSPCGINSNDSVGQV